MAAEREPEEWFCVECGVLRLGVTYDGGAVDEASRCMGCGFHVAPLNKVKTLLARHGLHLVTEADLRVLEACAAMTAEGIDSASDHSVSVNALFEAELARRGEKP